ncbi:MAG: hypothetical protein JSV98_03490 [candidate division WOR-3 bacterium]|nr:MAG: hypothetical protein JSV98_03490 [candidate division WOR-3 bacterium]
MVNLVMALCLFSQLQKIEPYKKWEIEIVTKKTDEYLLLVKNQPLSFSVEGPTYLRVYTRIVWPKGNLGSEVYKLILQENEIDEDIITFESEESNVSRDKRGRSLSKWRSFYIEVPEGMNNYKLTHWASPQDTILVKFAYESPKRWVEIPAAEYGAIIEAIEEERIVKYYELSNSRTVALRVNGPQRLRVIARLNYDEKMIGDQNYTLTVEENGKIERFPLKCYKSQMITYKDRKNIVPSNARSFHINLGAGTHILRFGLAGTVAESAALRFLVEEK